MSFGLLIENDESNPMPPHACACTPLSTFTRLTWFALVWAGIYNSPRLPPLSFRNEALTAVAQGSAHVYFTPQDAHLTIENRS